VFHCCCMMRSCPPEGSAVRPFAIKCLRKEGYQYTDSSPKKANPTQVGDAMPTGLSRLGGGRAAEGRSMGKEI
jgi:hypothetical protein